MVAPATPEEAAAALRDGGLIRIAGAGTRPWGAPGAQPETIVSTSGLDRILAHDAGDFTAVLEAGVPLATAQAAFAEHGQRLCLDPPGAGTIGGLLATADSGPLRHRYGTPRDLVIGATLALADGTVAKSGGTVIKNVAGYDLAKLVCGSYGTLALICRVAVRLHPLPPAFATAVFEREDAAQLDAIADDLAHRPLEADALDVRWTQRRGRRHPRPLRRPDLPRAGACAQRRPGRGGRRGPVARAARPPARPARPPRQRATPRAAADPRRRPRGGRPRRRGSRLRPRTGRRRRRSAARRTPRPLRLARRSAAVRAALDPWDADEDAALALQRRVKERFDPERRLNRGVFVGGI